MTGEPVGLAMGGLKQIGRAEETGGQAARLMDAAGNLLGKPSKVEKALDGALEVPGRAAPEAAQIVGPGGELLSTIAPKGAIVRTAEGVEKAPVAISAETMARLPNLSKIDAPEDVIATLARTAEANPDLIDRFRRGTITHDELVTDLAPRLGMTAEDFLRSKPGKALNEQELLVLRATVVDKARSLAEMAQQINTRGGIGALSDVEKAEAMRQLVDAGRLQAVARGAASTAGRSLNQQKIQIDTLLAQALVGKNEQRAAERALAAAQSKQARLQTRMDELEKARAAGQLSRDEAAELMRVRREAEAAAQEERAALFRRQAAREKDAKAALRQQEQAGKALEALGGRDVTEKVLKEFLDLQASDDPLAAAKFVKGLQQPSWWNRASIIRYGSMLSATSSHLANTTSNVIMSAVDLGMKPLAAGIDAARAAITGGPRTRYLAEASPQAQGMLEGAITGAKQAWTVLETGINPSDAGKLEHVRAGFGVNPAVDAIVEMPMRLMEAADLILRGAATGGNFRALAVRQAIKEGYKGKLVAARVQEIVQNAEDFPELVDRAQKLGARIVVQEKRAVTTYLSGMRRVPGLNYVSEVMLPFLRTPYNIAAQGVGLTPVGFLGVVNDIRRGRPGEAADTAARALFGTATMGVATSLAAQGFLTGAYPEDARERGVLPPGWQPWSVRIPHSDGSATYVSYQNLGPIGVPLALASLLGQDMAKGKAAPTPEYLGKIVASMAKYMSDQTFLRGIGDLVKAIDQPGRYAENLVESLATQIVPYGSLQRQLTRALDMGTRDPKGAMEAILALNPMTAGGVPAKLDPFGQPVHPAQTGIGSFISPSRYNVETPDPVLAEYRRLQAEGQDVGISKAPSKIFSVELTRDEQRQFQAQAGQMLREALTRLIPTRPYRALSDEDKATVLSRLEDAIRKTVAEQMAVSMGREFIRRHPDVQKEMKKQ
ncbi:MAG: hypothetical protein M1582_04595 [Actinobacteria bacterium]|nr:hypothetical protein [Actinomycetota bacterium]